MIQCVQSAGAAVAMKRCTKCGEEKTLGEFGKNSRNKDGIHISCRICTNARNRELWRNPVGREVFPAGMKRCYACKEVKPFEAFNLMTSSSDGRIGKCIACRRIYHQANSAKLTEKSRVWALANPERQAANRRRWDNSHREQKSSYNKRPEVVARTSERRKERFANDKNFRMKVTLCARMKCALDGIAATAATLELLGCNIPSLRTYLEARFKPGMTWENYGLLGWHIDHKKPCASFDLADPAQQRACFHFTNLQPLWHTENRKKGAKILCP